MKKLTRELTDAAVRRALATRENTTMRIGNGGGEIRTGAGGGEIRIGGGGGELRTGSGGGEFRN